MRVAPQVILTEDQRRTLLQWARGRSLPARQVERARVVLLAAAGKQDLEIAAEVGISNQKASRWRKRFLEMGLAGLEKDAPRPGRTPTITPAKVQEVVRLTTREKPSNATHWSTRTMAEAAGLSEKTVRRIWHKHGLKPHLSRTFKLSNDPDFAQKLEAIVGLYLSPPEHAIVLCADEKSQIQALDRTQPGLPIKKGRCGTMTHDYKRNGTATLFAAMNTLDGTVISMCDDRHRHQEWLKFLRVIDEGHPERPGNPPHSRQLRDAQASQGAEVAGSPPEISYLLHSHQQFVAQHGGAVLSRSHSKPTSPRHLPRCRGVDHGDR